MQEEKSWLKDIPAIPKMDGVEDVRILSQQQLMAHGEKCLCQHLEVQRKYKKCMKKKME